jgi:hypothetical protein
MSAQPLPQPKVGQCPSGYVQSGGYWRTDQRPGAGRGAQGRSVSGRVAAVGSLAAGSRLLIAVHLPSGTAPARRLIRPGR